MKLIWTLLLTTAVTICRRDGAANAELDSLTRTIKNLYDDSYNRNVRPPTKDGKPVGVAVDIYITSISSISEITMDFKINMYLRQRWRDPRLASENISADGVLLNGQIMDTWLPDLYLVNDKESTKSDVTVLNSFLRVNATGDIIYSLRVTATVDCDMQLRQYPFDVQTCAIQMGSYGHVTSELVIHWNEEEPIKWDQEIELPEHIIDNVTAVNCTAEYSLGWFSCISAEFRFKRNATFYIVGLFLPAVLIVVLSWVAFWIDKASIPGRVSLSVITILTMQNQMSTTMSQLPKFSYIKLIDAWMTGCVMFVFAGLLEYAVVNQLAVKEKKAEELELAAQMTARISTEFSEDYSQFDDRKDCGPTSSSPRVRTRRPEGKRLKPVIRSADDKKPECKKMKNSDKVDYFSRIMFPVAFVIFNIAFFCLLSVIVVMSHTCISCDLHPGVTCRE